MLLLVLFAGGIVRLVSVAVYGKPSMAVIALAALEIVPQGRFIGVDPGTMTGTLGSIAAGG